VDGDGWLDVARTRALWMDVFVGPRAIISEGRWGDRPSVSMPALYLFGGVELAQALRLDRDERGASAVLATTRDVARATRLDDMVRGVEQALLTPEVLRAAEHLALDEPAVLAITGAALSNIVSNVPAVLVLKPFVAALAHPGRAWLVLAMASTLAGNLTIVGSIANLIVVERARRQRVDIDFWIYLKLGVPVTLITIAIGAWWMR